MKYLAFPQRATVEVASPGGATGRKEHWFYVSAAMLIIAISVVGFGPSITDPSKRSAAPTALVIAHGITIGAWLLLFLTQVLLVAKRRIAAHRRLGAVAPVLALLTVVLGYIVLIDFARRGYDFSGDVMRAISRRDTPRFNPTALLFPLSELLSFGILVSAGLYYRHRTDIHKRLMLFAMVPILGEPVLHLVGHLAGRWTSFRGMGTTITAAGTLILLSSSAIHDRLSRRRIHPISLLVPILLFAWQLTLGILVFPSAAWRKFVAWLIL
jgi:uncharacterized membrane protein YozB (DUF420 family)